MRTNVRLPLKAGAARSKRLLGGGHADSERSCEVAARPPGACSNVVTLGARHGATRTGVKRAVVVPSPS